MTPDRPSPVDVARKKTDTVVLIITLLVALALLGIVAISDYTILFIVAGSVLASLFYVSIFQTSLLAGSMRVQNGKHAYLLEIANEITTALDVPPVDIYITQEPYLNAFAIGYTRPFSIVLHSAVVENLSSEEIKAILLHEIGHVVYHHTVITSYIGSLANVPGVGPLSNWFFGFWSRRAELACDRLAAAYLGDAEPVMNALVNIHVGPKTGQYMGVEGVVYQDIKGKGVMRAIAQSLRSHPFLVTRISEVAVFSNRNSIKLPQALLDYLKH